MLVEIGNEYFDTDDLSQEEYAEYIRLRNEDDKASIEKYGKIADRNRQKSRKYLRGKNLWITTK